MSKSKNTLNQILSSNGQFVTVDVLNSKLDRRVNGQVVGVSKDYFVIKPAKTKKAMKFRKSSVIEAVGQGGQVFSRV